MLHGHGNNLSEYAGTIRLDFSSNVAFNSKTGRLLEFLQGQLPGICNYPDPAASLLATKIAAHHGITPPAVLVTNGSAEAFYLVAQWLENSKSAVCIPAFAEYEDACLAHDHDVSFVALRSFTQKDFGAFQSVWLGNPNNPDGTGIPAQTILAACKASPSTYFVVDQAYARLTIQDGLDLMQHEPLPNLLVIHSLTKEFTIPGLRLGYITAHPDIIKKLSGKRPPWTVNYLALCAGEFIMDNYEDMLPSLDELIGESHFLQKEFSQLAEVQVYPSSCNFFLSRIRNGCAADLKETLIKNYGILIRDASNFRGLDPSFFRVAARGRGNNIELVNAIENILHSNKV